MKLSVLSENAIPRGNIRLPASKSISNRLLLIDSFYNTGSNFINLSEAGDTKLLRGLLHIIHRYNAPASQILLDTRNAGTVFRFLCAFLSYTPGNWLLTGSAAMLKRPVSPLVDALRQLGAEIKYLENEGYPPLEIQGIPLLGGRVNISARISSQFISALLMAGPAMKNGLIINLREIPPAIPYINMTIKLLKQFGAKITWGGNIIQVEPAKLQTLVVMVEADWSAASSWYQMAALASDADIFLYGLHNNSIQGDRIIADVFKKLGVRTVFEKEGIRLTKTDKLVKRFEFNFTNYPDLAPAIIVTCAALGIASRFSGLYNLSFKESDRLAGIMEVLGKMEIEVIQKEKEYLEILPGQQIHQKKKLSFSSHDDHRMAMCLAPLAFRYKEIFLDDGSVVEKSYPNYWDDLDKAGLKIISHHR